MKEIFWLRVITLPIVSYFLYFHNRNELFHPRANQFCNSVKILLSLWSNNIISFPINNAVIYFTRNWRKHKWYLCCYRNMKRNLHFRIKYNKKGLNIQIRVKIVGCFFRHHLIFDLINTLYCYLYSSSSCHLEVMHKQLCSPFLRFFFSTFLALHANYMYMQSVRFHHFYDK